MVAAGRGFLASDRSLILETESLQTEFTYWTNLQAGSVIHYARSPKERTGVVYHTENGSLLAYFACSVEFYAGKDSNPNNCRTYKELAWKCKGKQIEDEHS